MAENLQRSFDGLNMGKPQSENAFATGNTMPMRGSNSSLNGAAAFPHTFSGSSGFGLGPMAGAQGGNMHAGGISDPQSASARFERIFSPASNAAGPSTYVENGYNGRTSPFKHNQPLPGSLGPANGMPNGSAFGAFGHAFQPQHASLPQHGLHSASIFSSNANMSAIRSKQTGTRQGLPPQWGSGSDDVSLGSGSPGQGYLSNHPSFFGMPQGGAAFGQGSLGSPNTQASQILPPDDDIIPTAIVVKNIPFSIKREQLLQIIEELHIPMPYAFNYHFDQGVFRGLAFANFRSGEEADAVVAALNGFDVAGRKLRVEYKKVLQAGEKERIEKEKAIKRMQSMQMEKERMRRQTVSTGIGEDWPSHFGPMGPPMPIPPAVSVQGGKMPVGDAEPLDDASRADGFAAVTTDTFRSLPDGQADLAADAASELSGRREDLDLNDSATLEIYSRVLLFKDDRMRDELSFSKSLTPVERRIVHMVAKKLNLYHYSSGDGDDRFVTVTKTDVASPQRPLRSAASTIGRNNRGNSNASSSGGFSGHGVMQSAGRSALRMKKSAPDMKRSRERSQDATALVNSQALHDHSGSVANSDNFGFHSGAYGGALNRKSNGNLREGYTSSMVRRSNPSIGTGANFFASNYDAPPVPALPNHTLNEQGALRLSHSPSPTPIGGERGSNGSLIGANGALPSTSSQHILRQPAGPGGSQGNFAQRNRLSRSGNTGSSAEIASSNGTSQSQAFSSSPNLAPVSMHGYVDSPSSGGVGGYNNDHAQHLREQDVRTHEPLEV